MKTFTGTKYQCPDMVFCLAPGHPVGTYYEIIFSSGLWRADELVIGRATFQMLPTYFDLTGQSILGPKNVN